MNDIPMNDLTAGRFRSVTGLSDKALRLYAERGLLVPAAVDPVTGYRTYAAEQLRDGITLDLLRRAKIPLGDLDADTRFRFDDHRGRLAMLRAMEDFYLDLAERVADGDPSALVTRVSHASPTHWVGCEIPFGVSTDPDDLAETFSAMAVDIPHLDSVLVAALHSEGIELVAESWTTSAPGVVPRMRLAHRVQAPASQGKLRQLEVAVTSLVDGAVRVTSGTIPERQELVYSAPVGATADDAGIADTTLSYLASIAFIHRTAEDGVDALSDTARRRVLSTSLFDPTAVAEDVYDLAAHTIEGSTGVAS